MCASSQSFGTLPSSSDLLKRYVIAGVFEDILQTTSKGKQIDIALLDFSKAFDKVPHQRLNNNFFLASVTIPLIGSAHFFTTVYN
jgi:hypothetical protein